MRGLVTVFIALVSVVTDAAEADSTAMVFPRIARYGGIVQTPSAAEQPRQSAKIVFDIVADSKPDELNKGLESVARYLNLHAAAGHKPSDVKLALVLHGSATKAALGDAAYAKHAATTKNPNLELMHELKACGVEIFVCGQSLARNKFASADVADDVTVAVSAMTVNVNKQLDNYAYVSIH